MGASNRMRGFPGLSGAPNMRGSYDQRFQQAKPMLGPGMGPRPGVNPDKLPQGGFGGVRQFQNPGVMGNPTMGGQRGGFGGAVGGFGGFGAPAGGGLQGGPAPNPLADFGGFGAPPGGGLQAGPAPSAGIEQVGPGDRGPSQYDGMSGSDIFARLFGQRP